MRSLLTTLAVIAMLVLFPTLGCKSGKKSDANGAAATATAATAPAPPEPSAVTPTVAAITPPPAVQAAAPTAAVAAPGKPGALASKSVTRPPTRSSPKTASALPKPIPRSTRPPAVAAIAHVAKPASTPVAAPADGKDYLPAQPEKPKATAMSNDHPYDDGLAKTAASGEKMADDKPYQ